MEKVLLCEPLPQVAEQDDQVDQSPSQLMGQGGELQIKVSVTPLAASQGAPL